jgi:hypothetical protein
VGIREIAMDPQLNDFMESIIRDIALEITDHSGIPLEADNLKKEQEIQTLENRGGFHAASLS